MDYNKEKEVKLVEEIMRLADGEYTNMEVMNACELLIASLLSQCPAKLRLEASFEIAHDIFTLAGGINVANDEDIVKAAELLMNSRKTKDNAEDNV